jgi:hypothetical protein
VIAIYWQLDIRTVGDMGELPDTLPIFLWPIKIRIAKAFTKPVTTEREIKLIKLPSFK